MKLEQLLELYNFRLYRDDLQKNKENTDVIRIYLNYDTWFEFGIDDWGINEFKKSNINKILIKDILNRKVESFNVDSDSNTLFVYLEGKE